MKRLISLFSFAMLALLISFSCNPSKSGTAAAPEIENTLQSVSYLKDTVGMDPQDILRAFDNFGQEDFTHRNSSGNLSIESDLYFTLNQELDPRQHENFAKMEMVIRDGRIRDNKLIGNTLSFVGHNVKEDIHIHDARFSIYYYKDWIILNDLRVNNSISNFDLFGTYYQPDTALEVHMEMSLTDLLLRSRKKRMVHTDEGSFDLDRDTNLYLHLTGSLNHQKLKLLKKRKHQQAHKDQIRFANQVEEEFRVQIHEFYENYAMARENPDASSTLDLQLD